MDIMKKTKIEQYLQGPLWALLILAFVDIVFFFLDIRCGVILAVSLVVFLVFQMIIYSRSKQEIIKECMDFMFEQSQVQNYLLQQLPVPYALLDGNGMIIWSNDAFHKIVGENRGKSLQQIFPNLNRNLLPSDVMHSISHIEYKKKCKEGDKITLQIPEPEELEILPEKMDLDIVYEDQDVILINKPKNMVVHPAAGHYTGTLVNGLMAHCKDDLSGINGVLRPGIVHRIDKDTTGILIVCKNDMAHQSIAKQLYDHSITRKYHAIVYGNIKEEEGTVNAPIGRSLKDRKKMGIVMDGKHAVTHYKVLRRLKKGFTYIECQLETGRTHQIRVHMASIKHPLLGDDVYGPKKSKYTLEGQCLHAKVLGFVHPRTGEYMEFEVPLPEYFEKLLKKLDQ